MAALKLKGSLGDLSIGVRLAVGIVFVLVTAGAYFFILYSDVTASTEAKSVELEDQQGKLAAAEAAKGEYNKDLAEKARLDALGRKQKKVLPDDAEMPTFLSTIQSVATASGATLTSWAPGDEMKEEFYATVPMQLKLVGKYHQIAKFFYGVGQVDRIINMENIILTVKDGGAKDNGVVEDQGAQVLVECLATAFRALASNETPKKRAPGTAGAPPAADAHAAPAAEEKKE